jgi:hypothetical protein
MLKLNDGRKALYQWDVGVTATVLDNQINEVHFSNLVYGISYNVEVKDEQVLVPPEVLQSGADIYCWAYVKDLDKGYTKKEEVFNVIKRPKPSGYAYTPTDIKTWDELNDKIENIVVDSDNIKNNAVTVDKVNQTFFKDGFVYDTTEDIVLISTQKIPSKQIRLSAKLKNKTNEITEASTNEEIPTAEAVYKLFNDISGGITEITKDTYITELESGIYRCKLENSVCLFLDMNCSYGLVDGIAIVYKLSGSALYNFLMVGTDIAWTEHTMVGTYDSDTDTVTIKDLTSVLNAEDVLQSINQSTNNPPQAVYSANVMNRDIIAPVTKSLNQLLSALSGKEDKSNKVTEIEADNTDEQYASAKAVYDFGVKILNEINGNLDVISTIIGGEE